ncbi:LamG-like jellyroll fold domain-containing protein [Paenibacillus solanacearum]|uniref:LamG-like jellyroll fold domain-containing protein n=1 Tax=Paenibacillus solanacearum TaxID=2048548 RepID=UPI001C402A05|nr:LamG-like jellyroll fold domain-containing protein [Paenibacillus solanacearum]
MLKRKWFVFLVLLPAMISIVLAGCINNGDRGADAGQASGLRPEEASGSPAYLMAYFRSGPNQTQMDLRLHYAFSRDGLHWYELNDNKAVWKTSVGGGIIRDPFLSKGPDGSYHLVHTMNSSAGSVHKGKQLGYAKSNDLITFTNAKAINVMENFPNSTNVWAPEWNWDAATSRYMVHWSSTLDSKVADNNRIYKAYTTDWETFTPAELLFDPGYSVIDSHIASHEGKYYQFFKDENLRPMRNRFAVSDQLDGGYGDTSPQITPNVTEAVETLKLTGQQKWYLYYDYWADGKFGIKESNDMIHWSSELPKSSYRFPFQRRHATFLPITEEELSKLIQHFSVVARYGKEETGPLQFDGKKTDVRFTESKISDPFALRTVSMRVNAKGVRKTQVLYDEGEAGSGLAIKLENGQLKASVAEGGVQAAVSAEFKQTGVWRHVAVVFAEGAFKLYLDGQLVNETTAGFTKVGVRDKQGGLGRRFSEDAFGDKGDGAYFEGMLDAVTIYNTPLQDADVRFLFHHPGNK